MRLLHVTTILLAATAMATAAGATDNVPCPAGLICASAPPTVLAAIRRISPDATLASEEDGSPRLDLKSQAGVLYTLYFEDCTAGKKCGALNLRAKYEPDDDVTLAKVNKWNLENRLIKVSVTATNAYQLDADLSTMGGVTPTNFADVISWWSSVLDRFHQTLGAGKE